MVLPDEADLSLGAKTALIASLGFHFLLQN
jgi:hypothetical protein